MAATLLRGLSWCLFALSALMLVLIAARLAGLQTIPVTGADLLGAAVCAALGLVARLLAARFASVS